MGRAEYIARVIMYAKEVERAERQSLGDTTELLIVDECAPFVDPTELLIVDECAPFVEETLYDKVPNYALTSTLVPPPPTTITTKQSTMASVDTLVRRFAQFPSFQNGAIFVNANVSKDFWVSLLDSKFFPVGAAIFDGEDLHYANHRPRARRAAPTGDTLVNYLKAAQEAGQREHFVTTAELFAEAVPRDEVDEDFLRALRVRPGLVLIDRVDYPDACGDVDRLPTSVTFALEPMATLPCDDAEIVIRPKTMTSDARESRIPRHYIM
jgi:hypothetical protein